MKWVTLIISGLTAFAIGAGGAMGAVFVATKGVMPHKEAWCVIIGTGIVAAAKDTRSLLQLPPVNATSNTAFISKPTTQPTETKS